VGTIIKPDDPFSNDRIPRRCGLENYIPENSAKTKASIRIFTVMMNMKPVKSGKNFYGPTLM
jgi:hypothetical protein